jgi:penicillin-binding protein 2
MMAWRIVAFLAGLVWLLAACNPEGLPIIQDAYQEVTLTALPTDTPEATLTSAPGGAEGIGLAFFRAWEGRDYLGMYSLLSPRSQTLVDSRAFVRYYENAMETATVMSIHAQPVSSRQTGAEAELSARVTWETAAVGAISRDHRLEMVYDQGRWGIVWDEGLVMPELAGGNKLAMQHRTPARANIYDINGNALAFQGTVVTLGVVPGRIEDEDGLLAALSPVLRMTADEIRAKYASALPDWYVPLGDVTGEVIQDNFATLQPFFGPALVTSDRLTRLYTSDGAAVHMVGYTGPIPAERLAEYRALGYQGDETVGLAGVEAWGERYLSGTRGGVLSLVGPNNDFISVIEEREPRQARSVFTTIDLDFQRAVERALADAIESHPSAQAGSIVALDPRTGAVRAMATYPTYSPTIFDANRLDANVALARVLNDPLRPLVNRATQGEYPAGSLFKLVSFGAAMESGLYTPASRFTSTGSWNRLGANFIKYDWLEGGHGTISLKQALVVSCNSCFYDVGYNLDELDPFLLPAVARRYGLDQLTDIVGVLENDGLIPDPEWKLANIGEGWVRGDSVNMAIGQGYVQVTPLQMARIIAAIANGGTLYRPTVIDRIGAAGGAPEEPWPNEAQGQLPLSDEHLLQVQEALWSVTNSGSGTAAYQFERFPVVVAGKTGTAETVIGEPHAWFAGYAPAAPSTPAGGSVIEEPELAVVVMIEHSGEGSAVAAPVFRRVIELYYALEPLRPYPWE